MKEFAPKKPKVSALGVARQLRKRADLLDRFTIINNAELYREIAAKIESREIFDPEFGEKL